MIIHESCHLTAAVLIGLKPDCIVVHPFGVCLKLKNKIIRSLADEIILYASGPMSNILMALFVRLFMFPNNNYLYYANIFLFVTNMLPILPLDGGILAKRILTYYLGEITAKKILIFITVIICLALFSTGIYLIYINSFNYSVIVLAFMTASSLFTQKEKYNVDYTNELIYYSSKKAFDKKNIRIILHDKNKDIRSSVKKFRPNNYSLVCLVDENENITDILTEKKILNSLFK